MPLDSLAQTQEQRFRFMEAKRAFQNSNWDQFVTLKTQLADYILLPYLEYYYLRKNFATVEPSLIQDYLNKYPYSPMAAKLRHKWLSELAKKQAWKSFLAVYQPTRSITLQCYYLAALQQTGKTQQANPNIRTLWLTGKSRPDNCVSVFDTWLSQISNKDSLVWQRFELALKKYNFKLATHLTKKLSQPKQLEAQAIIKLYAQPYLVTQSSYINKQTSAEVISYGIFRLARRNPSLAIKTWEKLRKKYNFNPQQKQRIFQAIALKLALRKQPSSTTWFRKIVGKKLDSVYQEWMIRAALYHKNWRLVRDSIAALPATERKSTRWQYWYARALAELGQRKSAQNIFTRIAKERNYHGFLAGKHSQQALKVKHRPLKINLRDIQKIQQIPALRRAKLLYQINHKSIARLELYYLMKHSTLKQQSIIIKQVIAWGWHPQALRLGSQAKNKDDLTLRFPLIYQKEIIENANKRQLDPALIYAIIRQESYFAPNAHSPAGAIGLMQLLPKTAQKTSKQFSLKYNGKKYLLKSNVNIIFGSAHLRKLHQQFNNHSVLVLAAYNAGRRAVLRWLPRNKKIPADIWIETIPFYETRHYIKNVIAYYIVYQYRLGKQPNLDRIMRAVTK